MNHNRILLVFCLSRGKKQRKKKRNHRKKKYGSGL